MSNSQAESFRKTAILILGAIGVVYGVIGTSPLCSDNAKPGIGYRLTGG